MNYMSETYADNRKARFEYEILDTYDAGMELVGSEVKSIKAKKVRIEGSHVIVLHGECFILGMHVDSYSVGDAGLDVMRTRKLLLSKKEIGEIEDKLSTKGLTAVPLSLYSRNRLIKIKIAIARGKKLHDKREVLKKRDIDRSIRREYSS